MKHTRIFTALILAFTCCLAGLNAQQFQISAEVDVGGHIKISVRMPDEDREGAVRLFRSTRAITPNDLNAVRYPITTIQLASSDLSSGFVDACVAHNVTYYYVASLGDGEDGIGFSDVVSISVGDVPLPPLRDPEILIDKVNYILEVRDGREVVKRFPLILGRDPVSRKLHQDFRTTPEGGYRITYLKRNSTFHRALDIDYPNRLDRIRYDFLRSQGRVPQGKSIGGEIQVHGQLRNWALERNWTWGCIALRNGDIEEIFDHPDIDVGTRVFIVGTDITREDIVYIRRDWTAEEIRGFQTRLRDQGHYSGQLDGIMGRQTRSALGRFQIHEGYPVTCDLDKRTVEGLTG
jgi:hypothetical protein